VAIGVARILHLTAEASFWWGFEPGAFSLVTYRHAAFVACNTRVTRLAFGGRNCQREKEIKENKKKEKRKEKRERRRRNKKYFHKLLQKSPRRPHRIVIQL
jgi:hypothetical protein